MLFRSKSAEERIDLVEQFLMEQIEGPDLNAALFNSIQQLLHAPGGTSIREICTYSSISQRQMERLFLKDIGLSPKRLYCLVRYQKVWHDIVWSGNFNIQDEVQRYGYSDQAHLLKEFKRFHGVSPTQALMIAKDSR